ncbi:MAG: hypothetical protein GY804_11845 [Alphaproteobacteria bacterium]|nr:hypothetical protein [Alphaproteobacteria bacterium]
MAQDFYMNPATDDWDLENDTTIRLCDSHEELVRQRLVINLLMILGEWFTDTTYGVAYFESIYGKNTKDAADAAFKQTIRNTEGVTSITKYASSLDKYIREYTLDFAVTSDTGEIVNIEVTL